MREGVRDPKSGTDHETDNLARNSPLAEEDGEVIQDACAASHGELVSTIKATW
jgi:hypothetical protein